MSEPKFTKGVWRVQLAETLDGRNVWEVVTDTFDVCSCDLSIRNKCDAALIATVPKLYEALEETNNELHHAIIEINRLLKERVTCATENEPDWWDQQTVYENTVLLAKARGEL